MIFKSTCGVSQRISQRKYEKCAQNKTLHIKTNVPVSGHGSQLLDKLPKILNTKLLIICITKCLNKFVVLKI